MSMEPYWPSSLNVIYSRLRKRWDRLYDSIFKRRNVDTFEDDDVRRRKRAAAPSPDSVRYVTTSDSTVVY